ncbi:hypothetical protein [Methylobacterium platani]|nr:hypothetical protein [Methylobacterium platani]
MARKGQTIETIRTGLDHLDAGDGSGGDSPTHPDESDADAPTGLHAHR